MSYAPLGSVARITMGQAPPGNTCNKEGLGVPFVKAGEFTDGTPMVREWTTKPLKLARADDVLVCVVGATAGKVSRSLDCAIGRSVAAISPDPGSLDSRYLLHFLRTQVMRLRIQSQGLAQGVITREMLGGMHLPVPVLEEQRRIAAILYQADAIRTKRRQVLTHLDGLRTALTGQILEGRRWSSTLGDLAEVQIGPFGSLLHKSDYVEGGVPVINPMHIQGGALVADPRFSVSEDKASQLSLYRLQPGDVVMGRRGEMGRAAVARDEDAGFVCGTGSLILRSRTGASELLHAIVTSHRMRSHLERSSLGATLPNLNASIVKKSPAPALNDDLSSRFARTSTATRRLQETVSSSLRAADELFASLQSRAFRGEL